MHVITYVINNNLNINDDAKNVFVNDVNKIVKINTNNANIAVNNIDTIVFKKYVSICLFVLFFF